LITGALACASCAGAQFRYSIHPGAISRRLAAITLTAARGPNGRDAFVFDGAMYRDNPRGLREARDSLCELFAAGIGDGHARRADEHDQPAFHGLSVSPDRPQDDVLTLMAMPGQALDYTVAIPRDHLPGSTGTTRIHTARAISRSSMACRGR